MHSERTDKFPSQELVSCATFAVFFKATFLPTAYRFRLWSKGSGEGAAAVVPSAHEVVGVRVTYTDLYDDGSVLPTQKPTGKPADARGTQVWTCPFSVGRLTCSHSKGAQLFHAGRGHFLALDFVPGR